MIHSMTAYASRSGSIESVSWVWEVRGVNARGLDLRLRLPDGLDGVEQAVRSTVKAKLTRGNVAVSLKLMRSDSEQSFSVDQDQLDRVLTALDQVQDRAFSLGVTLGQPTAADVLQHRGVLVSGLVSDENDAVSKAIVADVGPLFDDFIDMRRSEGRALENVLGTQIDEIARLTAAATETGANRRDHQKKILKEAFERVVGDVAEADPARLEQELATIAVKQDITEELDRLAAHVDAARAMVTDKKPMGRKLDFLAQEFNREANTLCSKAQFKDLTAIGLDLKAVIDQMREQIQNVE